jgi:hypothetical protein
LNSPGAASLMVDRVPTAIAKSSDPAADDFMGC